MYRGFGHNGVTTTNIVIIESSQGMALASSSGGLRLQASGGLWFDSNANVRVNGVYRNIGASLAALAAAAGISLPS
jgi:hypothetical protein